MPTTDYNITANIIADSVNPKFNDCRLTTFVLKFPRIILAELNTHRMFSRSTSSSRAIPVKKQIASIKDNPFIPSWIGRNQAGMQANEEVDNETKLRFKDNWLMSLYANINVVERLEEYCIHKQITNRLLEPWSYCHTIVTATDFDNFFHLRCSPHAQPEFMCLAFKMLEAYIDSVPAETDYHVPFGDKMPAGFPQGDCLRIAVARCARVSYRRHNGSFDPDKDLALADKLEKDGHLSPFEHVAFANPVSNIYTGNFRGWIQLRKQIPKENINKVNHEKLLETKPDWA